jgi:hypothetical protein
MLPLFRIIPVGGVFLALMIVVLAHEPPGASHTARSSAEMPVHGALMRRDEHPEWRQFLILAAVRRADELSRLRELPDTPVRVDDKVADKIAGLPTGRNESDPEDETGKIKEMPKVIFPLDTSATSSTELTVITPEAKPLALKPLGNKALAVSRKKTPQRTRQAKATAKPQPASPSNSALIIRAEQY